MTLSNDLFEELFGAFLPTHPAVVYGLPTAILGGWLAVAADPVPVLALAVGVLSIVGLSVAYEYTDLQQESTDGERSTVDWIALGVFVLIVGGIVVVGEVDAISLGVSPTQLLGVVTGLLAGASVVGWLLPALRERAD